jgi:serine-type D-Ala-D-Ala carboxypeptidase/endopeptidase (penicillin-binding protein 4)
MIGRVLFSGIVMGGCCVWGETDVVVASERGSMEDIFEKWVAAEELGGALVGFCVLDEKGELVYGSPLAETALCPASVMKTLTAGAALGFLGEDFRFETRLMAGSEISVEGVVAGDLVLKGGGDPTLREEDLVAMAEEAVKKGLKQVMGTLRVDEVFFPNDSVSDHWVWGDIGNAYGAGAFGLNVGHNVLTLVFDGGEKVGDTANWLRTEPDMYEGIKWEMEVTTGPAGSGDRVMVYSVPKLPWIRARGTVPMGAKGFRVRAALPDPPRYARAFLKKELEKRGVVFSNDIVSNLAESLLVRHESAELPVIVDHMQKVSDNLEAQCLFLMMGVKAEIEPELVLKEYWEEMGVSFKGLRVIDGSGLARATMIRPVDLARVNFLARNSAYGERYLKSLPGNDSLRAKRGAMSGVRTEVGFVKRGEKEFTFALMGNGLGAVDFWKMREVLLNEIGRVEVDRAGSGE